MAENSFPLPISGNEVNVSPGRRFMIDLLVGSLMADGGLESALNAAITAEIQVRPQGRVCGSRGGGPSSGETRLERPAAAREGITSSLLP